ncbi:MAG: PAS domain S-box protein [Desulfomonilaceae bacterium]
MIIINLIQNVTMLVALAAAYQVVMNRFQRHEVKSEALFGLLFGGAGIVAMMTPHHVTPGIFFDGRSIILSVAGLFGGPLVAVIAAPICAVYRWWLGGPGALLGVLVIAESSLLGVLFFIRKRNTGKGQMGIFQLWGFGLLVHVIMLGLMPLTLGFPGLAMLKLVALPILALYPLATVLICLLFQDYEKQFLDRRELVKSESLYRNLVEHLPQRIFIKDINSVYVSSNTKYANDHGMIPEQIVGLNDFALYPKDLAEKYLVDDREVIKSGKAKNIEELYTENGQDRWIQTLKIPYRDNDGQVVGIMGICSDITDRKLTEEELRKSEEKYRTVFINAPIGIFRSSIDGKLVDVNPAFARIFAYNSPDEMISSVNQTSIAESIFVDPGSRSTMIDQLSALDDQWFETEVQYCRKDHKKILTRLIIRRIPGGTGLMEGFLEDITKRKRLEEVQHRLSTVVEQAAEGVLIADTAGVIQYVNPALESISGYSKAELIGERTSIFMSGEHNPEFVKNLWDTINSGKVWNGRFNNRKKDGTTYYVDATISPVRGSDGKIINFVAMERDVTEQLQLSQQLLQAQKMETIGTLAGGIAHDFNNLLQVVLGYSELMLLGKKEGEDDFSHLNKIFQAGKRGSDLVKNLLAFSRKMETRYVPVNLNQEVTSVQGLLSRTIPKTIKFELHLGVNLKSIQADQSQIGQVLMNLGLNARDGMPDGGTLTIKTENVELNEQYYASDLEVRPGSYVLLTFSDTGQGMDKETLDHIFEPFYTTKGTGKGTGLGLATVYGIIKQHNGHIDCESQPGFGTTFRIYFPAIQPQAKADKHEGEVDIHGGRETILLVDDDEIVRDFGLRVLGSFGYEVIIAGNGKEALDVYRKEANRISLVILDVIMPEMDGNKCLSEILRINPEARVLLASGLSPNSPSGSMLAKGFVEKPFDIAELMTTIRKILDAT